MIGMSGILAAAAVFIWAGAVAFWSRRWSVWAVAVFSLVAFYFWKMAFQAGRADLALWVGSALLIAGLLAIVALFRRARAQAAAEEALR